MTRTQLEGALRDTKIALDKDSTLAEELAKTIKGPDIGANLTRRKSC